MLYPKSKIILAFPGMGKTPLCRKTPGYVDADFGNYREYLKVPKEQERRLLRPFSEFLASLETAKAVLSNEPKLAEEIKIHHMYLPANPSFSARKMKVTEIQIVQWVAGWSDIAKKFGIPVTYLNVGLDKYLK